jgi:CheY-like chemotaxis protein
MNGAQLIRELRRSGDDRLRGAPAIGLTGYEEAAQDLVSAGALCALAKPCGERPILDVVARALSGRPVSPRPRPTPVPA